VAGTRTFTLAESWGHSVAARRESLRLSQAQLSELCEVTQQTISKIERGLMTPRDELKLRLAVCLRTTPGQLFPWPRAS
jgi:transcriptional regulator with XRE-family HTH domain